MKLSQQHRNFIKLLCVFFGAALAIVLLIAMAKYVAPLIVALIFYYISKPLSKFLVKKLKLNSKIAAIITTIVLFAVMLAIAILLIAKLVNEFQQIISNFSNYSYNISTNITAFFNNVEERLDLLQPNIAVAVQNSITSLFTKLSSLVTSAATKTFNVVVSLPKIIVFVIASAVCFFMLIKDKTKIYDFFDRHIPHRYLDYFERLKSGLFSALFGYIKAQAFMCCITFCELMIALNLLSFKYALLFSVVIAVMDALPLFGCGLFLIPWTLYSFVVGDYKYGIGIGILYICTLVIRQIIEPRILGQNIGMYPLVTLLSMYAGLQIWGVAGLFLGPFAVLLIKAIMGFLLGGKSLKEYVRTNKIDENKTGSGNNSEAAEVTT